MIRLRLLLVLLASPAFAAGPPLPDPLPAGASLRIGTARLRHGGLVRGLAFAPDGHSLASVGHDQTVSVWEMPTGRERYRFRGHSGDVLAVAYSADGRLIASGGSDATVRLWSVAGKTAGQMVALLHLPSDSCEALAFDPSGKRLAVGSDDGTVRVLTLASHKNEAVFSVERAVRSLSWSSDGERLAVAADRPGIVLWLSRTRRPGKTLGDATVQCLSFAPRGNTLVGWEVGGALTLWDASSGKKRWQTPARAGDPGGAAGLVYQIAFSGDGKQILVGDPGGSVERYGADGKPLGRFAAHRGRVTALAVSPSGLVASGGADHAIRLWHGDRFASVLPRPEAPGPVVGLALGTRENLAVYSTAEVRPFDTTTGWSAQAPFPSGKMVALRPDGRSAWLVTSSGQLALWERSKGSRVLARELPPLAGIAAAEAADKLLSSHTDGSLWVRDKSGKRMRQLDGLARRVVPLLSADGRLAVAVGQTAQIPVWDARTAKTRLTLAGHSGGSLAGAIVSATRLVSGGRDRMMRYWDLQTGKEIRAAAPHDGWVTAVAASADGKLLASATTHGDVRVWSADSGLLLAELPGHRGSVSALAFTADGKSLVSGGQDTTILIWDIKDLYSGKPRPVSLSPERAEELWLQMRDPSLPAAQVAVGRLARDPARAASVLKKHLRPVDGAKIARLIQQLDSDQFAQRQAASNALAELGAFAEGPMETALGKDPSLQVRRQLQILLDRCATDGPKYQHRQALLGVDLLGLLDTPEAVSLLKQLAGGAGDAELTRRAKKALRQLQKKK